MCSAMGHRTIAQFMAFRTGFNHEEIEAGLVVASNQNSNKISESENKYPHIRAKVFTNMVAAGEDSNRDPSVVVDRDMLELRKELAQNKKSDGEREIRDIMGKAIDEDSKTYLEKFCRGFVYSNLATV